MNRIVDHFYSTNNASNKNKHYMLETTNKSIISAKTLDTPVPIVKGINVEEEKKFDIESAEEISDNLELFKLELTSQLLKLQKNQKKTNMNEVVNEFIDFKQNFRETIENTNRKRDNEMKKLLAEMKELKNEIKVSIRDEIEKEKKDYIILQSNVKAFRDEMNRKIDQVERTQRMHMDQMRFLLMNSGDERVIQMAEKYFLYEDNEEIFDDKKLENIYVNPSVDEVNSIIEDINLKKEKAIKMNTRKDTSQEVSKTKKIIKKSQRMNENLNETFNENHKDDKNFNDLSKSYGIEGRLKLQRNSLFKKSTLVMGNKLMEYDTGSFEMSGLNKFRSYVYAVLMQIKLKNIYKEANKHIRLESLKFFCENYQNVFFNLKSWIINSTITAFNSVN